MMLNKEIVDLINEQINKEFYSAYFYLDIANYYRENSLNGFANWFTVQAQEEQAHAIMFMNYLQDNGEKVVLKSIEASEEKFEGYQEALEATYRHEQFVSQSIDTIYGTALEKREFRTTQFLEWFIKEQVEEEKNTEELINKYKLFASDGKGLYLLDTEMATRVYVAPNVGV